MLRYLTDINVDGYLVILKSNIRFSLSNPCRILQWIFKIKIKIIETGG
jgi:hypothetical protein